MKEGEQIYCALYWSEHAPPQDFEEAYGRLVWTAHHWQHWLDRGTFPDHPWRSFLQRSALTLKGLTYAPTGALIAAATTSLPETPQRRAQLGLPLQLDPRLDVHAVGALHARLRLGGERLLLLHRRRRRGRAGPAGHVRRRTASATSTSTMLDHLGGYEGARPVRIGNDAYKQRQHDVWGALLDSVYLHTRSRDSLDERVWPILKRQVEAAIDNWREPDRGIWEVRGEPKHFTSSKMFCWVGVRPRRAAGRDSGGLRARASAGGPPPTRSTPTSASTASTSAACSSSTTRRRRSTRRCC